MPIVEKNGNTVLASEAMSTKAAAAVLASQTRAFGNKYAKLSLQHATASFLQAKEAFLQKSATAEATKPNDQ
jgi:hypothetical protein